MKDIYIFKAKKLYAKLQGEEYFLYKNNEFILSNENISEILDILPEGIDLKIMLEAFNAKKAIELLPYLKNTIGDFEFCASMDVNALKPKLSTLLLDDSFPNILECKIDIKEQILAPISRTKQQAQKLSLSGYQHKIQACIIDGVIMQDYGDFILKPRNPKFSNLAVNEHLNLSFMREFGFEVPFNALVFDERFRDYHYLIKRFDINERGEKIPLISLNALMRSEDKYSGTMDKIADFLSSKLNKAQKLAFVRYIYANALLFNNDLHKKNISFVFDKDKLMLSPAYDIINAYPIRALANTQCALTINGRLNDIRIRDFENISKKLGLDFIAVQNELKQILKIYLDLYPSYIEKLSKIPQINGLKEFKSKLLESYAKCLRTAKIENILSEILQQNNQTR